MSYFYEVKIFKARCYDRLWNYWLEYSKEYYHLSILYSIRKKENL